MTQRGQVRFEVGVFVHFAVFLIIADCYHILLSHIAIVFSYRTSHSCITLLYRLARFHPLANHCIPECFWLLYLMYHITYEILDNLGPYLTVTTC